MQILQLKKGAKQAKYKTHSVQNLEQDSAWHGKNICFCEALFKICYNWDYWWGITQKYHSCHTLYIFCDADIFDRFCGQHYSFDHHFNDFNRCCWIHAFFGTYNRHCYSYFINCKFLGLCLPYKCLHSILARDW